MSGVFGVGIYLLHRGFNIVWQNLKVVCRRFSYYFDDQEVIIGYSCS